MHLQKHYMQTRSMKIIIGKILLFLSKYRLSFYNKKFKRLKSQAFSHIMTAVWKASYIKFNTIARARAVMLPFPPSKAQSKIHSQ